MKKNLTIVALVAIIVVCIGIVRSNFAEGEDDGYRSGRERALIKKFDKDGDGELSEEEKSAIRELEEQREKAYLKKYDTDGDGKIVVRRRRRHRGCGSSNGWKSMIVMLTVRLVTRRWKCQEIEGSVNERSLS